jgi:NADP-dependent 3-hydroxy acid dehydrogenase YdfG
MNTNDRRMDMLLEHKSAVIYGAGGAIGSAVARAFAREGARLFLAGRTLATLDAVARDISAAGGVGEAAQVDALDESSVAQYIAAVAKKVEGIDVSFNAIGMEDILLKRLPSLADVGHVAVLMASDYAGAMTGTVANLSCGQIVD